MSKFSLKEFQQAKAKVEAEQTKLARAEGVMQRILSQLQEEFGVASLEEAENKAKALKQRWKKIQEQLDEVWLEFKCNNKEFINDEQ